MPHYLSRIRKNLSYHTIRYLSIVIGGQWKIFNGGGASTLQISVKRYE